MVKKILLFTMVLIFSLTLYSQNIHAASIFVNEPAANEGGLWHVEEGSKVYVFMRYAEGITVVETGSETNSSHPEFDTSYFTSWSPSTEAFNNDFYFPNTINQKQQTIENPNPSVYDSFHVEIIANMLPFERYGVEDGTPVFKEIYSYDGTVDEITVNLHDFVSIQEIAYITLDVDGQEVLSSENSTDNPLYNDIAFGVRMYWETSGSINVEEPINPGDTVDAWSSLPVTSGSPVNPLAEWGTVSDIYVSNQTMSFDVHYRGTTYPVEPFTVDGDLDFISKANDVLYYTDPETDDRMLYFNFGETLDSAILTARTFTNVDDWKGEALWNLTQNEIKVTDMKNVYNYIPEADNDGNIYSYFYMPDVPIDNLISVSAVLAYRYWDDGFLNFGGLEPGDIQYKSVAAVKGETNSVNPTWVEDTYKSSALVTVGLVGLTATGIIPGYGWAISIASFLVTGGLTVADVNEWFAYDVNQMENVIPNVTLANEINSYIAEKSGDDSFDVDTDKLYKLHLATLQDGDEVEIMDDYSNVTQVVWETDGQIYVVGDDSINDSWFGPGTLEPPAEIGNGDLDMIVYAAIGLMAFAVIIQIDNRMLRMIVIAAIIYFIYDLGILEMIT